MAVLYKATKRINPEVQKLFDDPITGRQIIDEIRKKGILPKEGVEINVVYKGKEVKLTIKELG